MIYYNDRIIFICIWYSDSKLWYDIRLWFKKRLNCLRSKRTCSNVVGVYDYFNLAIKPSFSVCFHVQIQMRIWKSKMMSIGHSPKTNLKTKGEQVESWRQWADCRNSDLVRQCLRYDRE